jgi:hypothetical protein
MDTNSLPERDKGAQACVNTRYLWRNEKAEQPCRYAPHTVCKLIRVGPEQPVMDAQAYASGRGGGWRLDLEKTPEGRQWTKRKTPDPGRPT